MEKQEIDEGGRKEHARQLAKLKKIERDFPWLWGIISTWHPGLVDIGIYTIHPHHWDRLWYADESKVWFKVKDQSHLPYEELFAVTPGGGEFSFRELKGQFQRMSDVKGIEYIVVVSNVPPTVKKIILIFRPLKPKKFF